MDVFLSYPRSEKRLAQALRQGLEAEGLEVFDAGSVTPGSSWRDQLEHAAESARLFLLVIDDLEEASHWQRAEWQTALEAAWKDPSKRLVPVLPRGADLPAFARSAAGGRAVQALRLDEERDLEEIVRAARQLASDRDQSVEHGATSPGDQGGHHDEDWLVEDPNPYNGRAGDYLMSEDFAASEVRDREVRLERLAEIRRFAEELRK